MMRKTTAYRKLVVKPIENRSYTRTRRRWRIILKHTLKKRGEEEAVAQWLRCCATNRKVAGSIPAGVSGIFH